MARTLVQALAILSFDHLIISDVESEMASVLAPVLALAAETALGAVLYADVAEALVVVAVEAKVVVAHQAADAAAEQDYFVACSA
jgi:hypothetical protein